MRTMVIDGGARGQAIASKLASEGNEVFVSPGSPGNEDFASSTGVAVTAVPEQLQYAKNNGIELTIVGADDPLALGVVDAFQAENQTIFGPTRAQARIEWDREYAKELGRKHQVPMGPHAHFAGGDEAIHYALSRQWPLYVKDNGLAAGKGATKCETVEQFVELIDGFDKSGFFEAGKTIVVEDYITGPEASHHAFCDGKTQLTIPFVVRDHKQLGEGDTGLMTGGMGVIGPLPQYAASEVLKLGETFVRPIVQELGFKGVLFSGLKGLKGNEQNLEWNARFGDPETQVFLRLMQGDLLPVIMACIDGDLENLPPPVWRTDKHAVSLVLAAPGYPGASQKGMVIDGIHDAKGIPGVQVLHAATKWVGNSLHTNGGRVLNVVTMADTLEAAINAAYAAAGEISFNNRPPIIRRDIGRTALAGN